MDRSSKILFIIVAVLVVSGSMAVLFFTSGSIIGEPGSSEPCEWTVTQTEENQTFTDFGVLNETLQEELGEEWESFYNNMEVRKNPETGVIEDRLPGDCKFAINNPVGGSS